ncbi:formate transporter FocA [uncultured Endozoicomonas sp.]|uniref:formate transporter FocA n=1 Tax=uncultured Endozoicomonas sp. TaxID=432652 RepID=UPI002619682E|nr:formate transporter FocA [uncultured Endozoicomonas sp.]
MQIENMPNYGAVPPAEMAKLAEQVVLGKAKKHPEITLILAVMAGVFVAIGAMFYTITMAGAQGTPYGLTKLVGGIVFSVGLMLVVLCGGELFTSSTMLLMGKATGKLKLGNIVKNWSLVYLGNFIGSIMFATLIVYGGIWEGGNGQVGLSSLYIAKAKLGHPFVQDIVLGLLCNLLVCLCYWMTLSARTAAGKMMACVLPVAAFVVAGFEHSVANMYLLPVAYMTKAVAGPEFWQAIGYSAADFDMITLHNIVMNLIPVTIGNILGGGVMVGLSKWFVYLRVKG